MIYLDPRSWPEKNEVLYLEYVAKLAGFTSWLCSEGFEVVLFRSAPSDGRAIDDLLARLDPKTARGIRRPSVTSVAELMRVLLDLDVTIATRLHGVLLSHLAERPVLALSYERKVCALMQDFGNSEFCLDIHDFDETQLRARFRSLLDGFDEVSARNRARVSEYGQALDRQYRDVLGA